MLTVRRLMMRYGKKAGDNFIAVTANRDGALAFDIPSDQIFDFWDWVGGRYSVWSAVGLSLQIAFGPDVFDAFLKGAAKMDMHFRDQPLQDNLPVMMALTGIWNRNANCFAQSEALMLGKPEHKVREELEDRPDADAIAPQKTFPGNRPSTTITLDELSPFALGHLIALYEHKVKGEAGSHDASTTALMGLVK